MQIWIDGDACPVPLKKILYRAAERTGLHLTVVSNQPMSVPETPNIHYLRVEAGFDVADGEILQRLQAGDLVVTGDIPLAAEAIAAGAQVLNLRGERLSENNIAPRLQLRNMLAQIRDTGTETSGPPPFRSKDRQAFANQLDQILSEYFKRNP